MHLPSLLLLAALAHAEGNLNSDLLPPKVIYHIGEKQHLQEDAAQGTIPDKIWQEKIMGSGTNFGLVPYRRGLYGGANFDSLELYGNLLLGSPEGAPKAPWLMKITLKEECRRPAVVSDLATDEKYLSWLLKNINGIIEGASSCLKAEAEECGALISGTQAVAQGREANLCDDLVEGFFKEANPKVVRDTEWDASWYLRDRSCIEKLEASPETALQAIAEAKLDWQSRRESYSHLAHGYGTFSFALLADALAEAKNVDQKLLAEIRAKAAASDIRADQEPASPKWFSVSAVAAVDAYERCARKDSLGAFRGIAKRLAEDLGDKLMLKTPYDEKSGTFREDSLSAATKAFQKACP